MRFVFDLDGTICFKGKPLSDGIVAALDCCIANGHEVIFASARPIRDMLPVLPKHLHQCSMVGGNGTFVAKEGEIVKVTPLDHDTVNNLLTLIKTYNLQYFIDSTWDYSYTGSEQHPIYQNIDIHKLASNKTMEALDNIVKMVLFPNEHKSSILNELHQLPIKVYEYKEEDILDICPKGIDKWSGLQELGLEEGNYIAFGNDINDVSMLSHAKIGVCVGEHEILSSIASTKVHSNEKSVINKMKELAQTFVVQMQKG